MTNGKTVGVSIGILHDGESSFYNYGEVRLGTGRAPTNQTRYAIASITKTFTGALLAKAVIEGRVKLDDDVRKYLRSSYPNLEFQGKPIRLWHLVDHVSGLPFNMPEGPLPWTLPGYDPTLSSVNEARSIAEYSPTNFLSDLHKVKLTREPGVSFSYSNAAAQLAGIILERVYGASYEKALRRELLAPLGMRDTKVSLSDDELAAFPRAYGSRGEFLPALSTRMPAHAALKSTTEDMLKYIAWNMAEGSPAVVLAHSASAGKVFSNNFYVGLNWQILLSNGVRLIFQDGNVPGFHSLCVFCPELKLGIIVLTNGYASMDPTPLSPLVNQILRSIDPRMPKSP